MKKFLLLLGVYLMSTVLLTGCGGSGGDSDSKESPVSSSTVIAVDPYIIGAVFNEVTPTGGFVQTSDASDETGQALFHKALTLNNLVVMVEPGIHSGAPFKGTLKLKVDTIKDVYIISPLTTLMVELNLTAAGVADLLQKAGIPDITAGDFSVDPMAAVSQGKLTLVIANLAANAALNTTGADNVAALQNSISAVYSLMKTMTADANDNGINDLLESDKAKAAGATSEDLVKAIVAAIDYIVDAVKEQVHNGETPNFNTVSSFIDSSVLTDLIVAAATNQEVALTPPTEEVPPTVPTEPPVVVVPTGSIQEYLDAAFAAWDNAKFNDPATGDPDIDTSKFLATVDNFLAAKALIGTDISATDSEIEQARFFGSIAGLAKMADPYSDMTDNGLTNLGDFLDAFGIDKTPRQSFGVIHIEDCVSTSLGDKDECSIVELDPNSPTAGEVLNALRMNMIPRLQGVIDGLEKISPTFNCRRTIPGDSSQTEFDYSDVLFFKGLAQAMIGQLDMMLAYDVDLNIADENEISQTEIPGETTGGKLDAFLNRNANFGTLSDDHAVFLTDAKTRFSEAVDALTAAVNSIVQEIGDYANPADNQSDEFISLVADDPVQTQKDIEDTLRHLADFKDGLSSAVVLDNKEPSDPNDDITGNLFKIFNGIDLREQMPPYDSSTRRYGMFPDATLGGVLDPAQYNVNEDSDNDGVPDILSKWSESSYQFSGHILRHDNLPTYDRYRGYVNFTKNDMPLSPQDFDNLTVTNSLGQSVPITLVNQGNLEVYSYILADCTTSSCLWDTPTTESGISFNISSLPLDDYTVTGYFVDGQISIVIPYNEDILIPIIDSTTMNFTWLAEDLVLSWVNPTDKPYWDKVDILRINLYDTSGFFAQVDVSPINDSVVVPAPLIQAIKDNGSGTLYSWRIDTRAYTDDERNPQNARGWSNTVIFQ